MNKDLFGQEIVIDNFWSGSEYVSSKNIKLIKNHNLNVKIPEYYNSIIYQILSKMALLKLDKNIIIFKLSPIMGFYNVIKYCDSGITEHMNKELIKKGVTLRGASVNGIKDSFGCEYVYNTNNFIKATGSKYSRVRNILKRYKKDIRIENGINNEVVEIANKWSNKTKSNHQIKLLKIIKDMQNHLIITRVYIKNEIIGFSVVEKINESCGVIVQRLINPEILNKYKEPNILIHYADCLQNPNTLLNIGASRTKNIKIAKSKLVPDIELSIQRKISKTTITKKEYYNIKNSIKQ